MSAHRLRCCTLLLLFAFMWAPWLVAQESPGGSLRVEPAVCADPGASLLWEVTGAALEERGMTLHLFGSIHVGKPAFYPLHPLIEERFHNAEHLVFEVDPATAMDPRTALRMQLRGMLPAGQTLADVISPAALVQLEAVLDRLGVSLDGFMHVKPWLMTLMLANFQANALGYNALNGLEMYFNGRKSPGTVVHELESLDQQVDMLDGLDPGTFLDYSLNEFDTSAEDMERLIRAWECADHDMLGDVLFSSLDALEAAPPEQVRAAEALFAAMFTERNQRMADGIAEFIATGDSDWFVVVGAAHLLGEDSIVDLLRQRGFRVEAVRLD